MMMKKKNEKEERKKRKKDLKKTYRLFVLNRKESFLGGINKKKLEQLSILISMIVERAATYK